MRESSLCCFIIVVILTIAVGLVGAESQRGDLNNPDQQNIRLLEPDRVQAYHERNYKWPLDNYNPNTTGWRNLMEHRFRQVEEISHPGDRYQGYINVLHASFLVPNFTEHGFGLARCPDELLGALQRGIHEGLPTARLEHAIPTVNNFQALFIDRPDLTDRVLTELRHYAETWAQFPLTPYRAYGFRVYRNSSQLNMHLDKMQTHIISFILHIDSSEDAEPWPLYIEGFDGKTHEVILAPGDMLFYESSKCFHGRPKPLNGSWYTSIFVHYYPKYGWYDRNHELEAHYAVPPHWRNDPPAQPRERPLQLHGTSFKEPDCPNDWCGTQNTVQWSGPAKKGYWTAPTMEKIPFEPQEVKWSDEL